MNLSGMFRVRKKRVYGYWWLAGFLSFVPPQVLAAVSKKINVSVIESYDDNVFLSRQDRQGDAVANFSLDCGLDYSDPRREFELFGTVLQQAYSRHSGLNNNSRNVTCHFSQIVSKRHLLDLRNTYRHAEEAERVDEVIVRGTERYKHDQNRSQLEWHSDLSRRLGGVVRLIREYNWISSEDHDDSVMTEFVSGVNYHFSSSLSAWFSYGYERREFHSDLHASLKSASLTVRKDLTKQIQVAGMAGVDFIRPFHGSASSRFRSELSFRHVVDERTATECVLERRVETHPFSETLFEYYRASIRVSRDLFRRCRGFLLVYYMTGRYFSTDRKNRLLTPEISVHYEMRDAFFVETGYSYSRMSSSDENSGYDRNRIRLGVRKEF